MEILPLLPSSGQKRTVETLPTAIERTKNRTLETLPSAMERTKTELWKLCLLPSSGQKKNFGNSSHYYLAEKTELWKLFPLPYRKTELRNFFQGQDLQENKHKENIPPPPPILAPQGFWW
jgi:hypothetical protein